MKYDYQLNVSAFETYRFVRRYMNDTASQFSFRLISRFSGKRPCGTGSIYKDLTRNRLKNVQIVLGSCGLPGEFSMKLMPDSLCFKLLDSGMHESQHMNQWHSALFECDDMSFLNACIHFGHRYNRMHYEDAFNYRMNFTEIDAEKSALLNTHRFLLKRFPDFDADSAVLDYVNDTISKCRLLRKDNFLYHFDYGGRDFHEYKSMSELNSAFEEMEFRSLSVPQPYSGDRVMCMDEFTWIMNRNDPPEGYNEFFRMFQNEFSPIKQMEMLASLSAWLHPEEASLFPCFSDGRILPERVFGKPFPESRESAMARNLNTVKPKLWKQQNTDENRFLDTFLQKAEQMENGWNALPGPDGPDFL